jgi:hypothetical protein
MRYGDYVDERWTGSSPTMWRFARAFLDRYVRGRPGESDYLRAAARGPGGAVVRTATGAGS